MKKILVSSVWIGLVVLVYVHIGAVEKHKKKEKREAIVTKKAAPAPKPHAVLVQKPEVSALIKKEAAAEKGGLTVSSAKLPVAPPMHPPVHRPVPPPTPKKPAPKKKKKIPGVAQLGECISSADCQNGLKCYGQSLGVIAKPYNEWNVTLEAICEGSKKGLPSTSYDCQGVCLSSATLKKLKKQAKGSC